MSGKHSLDAIIGTFRREESGQSANANPDRHFELEIRLQDVDAANFSSIYSALVSSRAPDGRELPMAVGAPELSQTIGALMPMRARAPGVSGMRAPGTPQTSSLRELRYERGKKVGESYSHKEPLMLPWHSPRGSSLAYSVSLSAEIPDRRGVISDESALIRVKARASFPFELPSSEDPAVKLSWRADLTVVREFSGTEAGSISAVVGQMFRTTPAMTPQTLLKSLGVVSPTGEIVSVVASLYRYEVEVEFVAARGVRDLLRAPDVVAAADTILGLASPERVRDAALQAAIFRAAKYIVRGSPGELRAFEYERGLRQLLPQARALTRADYREKYPPRGFFLTDKADGRRALGFACDGRGMIAANELYDGFTPVAGDSTVNASAASASAASTSTVSTANTSAAGDTILDGELITNPDGTMTFYAFDVIVVAGTDLTQKGFEVRVLRIAEGVAALVAAGVPARAKEYAHIISAAPADLERAVRSVYEAKRPYEVDGLIFVEPEQSYSKTLNFKWKSAAHNTIDFLARRVPASVLGRAPYIDRPGHKLYFLFVGINPQLYSALGLQRCPGYAELFPGGNHGGYFPIQFAPSDVPLAYLYEHPEGAAAAGGAGGDLDGQIVEMRCAGNCDAAAGGAARVNWELVRMRDDRRSDLMRGSAYFGNDFRIAELTWLNYVDVFPLEQLWTGPGSDYFQKPRAGIYRAQTAVMNFAKTRLIESLGQANWVVDVGAGRGSDLGRYFSAGVGHLIAVDNDRAALAELVRRRFDHAKRRANPIGAQGRTQVAGRGTTLYILAADANDPYAALRERFGQLNLPADGADALVCNLAVHYFMCTTEAMKNFALLARATVRAGGSLVLTVLVGELVHKAFLDAGVGVNGSWDRNEAPAYGLAADGAQAVRKYSMRRNYASKTLEAAGQRIGVLLPFSDGQYYEECLVNVGALSKVLAARGFGAPVQRPIVDSIDEFAAQNRPLAAELTAADREWLGLYATLVYRREK
jgi:hypothetical protein